MKRILLLLILLGAFALRVYALGSQSLWYDEAVTARIAGQGLAELTRWTAGDIQPPLYYYVVAGWTRIAGNSEWALRFPSAFFSTVTVALLWATARRLWGRGGAWPAAVLAATSALYVYYAQEARMYALLTFLGLLSGYALLRALDAQGRQPPHLEGFLPPERRSLMWWLTFILASTAALYTHYFAAFLLLAYGFAAAGALLVRRHRSERFNRGKTRRTLFRGVLSLASIALLYAPWLPAMLTRYRVDASYWQGALKLGEAIRHIAISFVASAPQAMLEASAVRWTLAVAAALALGSIALAATTRRSAGSQRVVWPVLIVVLLLPIAAVLVLASRTPKFNPRYLMLASPAYLLIVAGIIAGLWGQGRLLRVLGAAVFAVVLTPALLGVWNWFNVPLFTKAQWREAAAYIQSARGPDEPVILVSGHAEPAWSYYAPGVSPVRLPPTEILDVNAVLGFDAGRDLSTALAGKEGAWLVTWQDEVVDPMGVVPFLLDRTGEQQPVGEQFWHVGVQHWRLQPGAEVPAAPKPQHKQEANFDHKLALLGWDDPANGELVVYWRTLNTLTQDYQVSLILEDGTGAEVGRWDGRPSAYDYPAPRWRVGEAVFGRYPLPALTAVHAGPYTASIAVYSNSAPDGLDIRDVADNPAGKRVRLGPFTLSPPAK